MRISCVLAILLTWFCCVSAATVSEQQPAAEEGKTDGRLHAETVRNVLARDQPPRGKRSVLLGAEGVTPPGGNQGAAGSIVNGWAPDLIEDEDRLTLAILVKL